MAAVDVKVLFAALLDDSELVARTNFGGMSYRVLEGERALCMMMEWTSVEDH
jgi:hypothetical protein